MELGEIPAFTGTSIEPSRSCSRFPKLLSLFCSHDESVWASDTGRTPFQFQLGRSCLGELGQQVVYTQADTDTLVQ